MNPAIVDLVINMLKFNPSDRFTAEQCLQNPIFDQVRKRDESKLQGKYNSIIIDEYEIESNTA